MATYKVLQDIEAEDTLVGPLTLRQCIYAGIAAVGGYLTFVVISKGVPYVAVIFLPFIAFGAFFAFPWSKQQTTEVWALAKVRFFLKPRKRIWNQSGTKQLVTITAPKVPLERQRRNLSTDEVQNRLRALADTIDSRGWAVKNIELGYYTKPSVMLAGSDRLVDAASLPQEVPMLDPNAESDIFDVANNPIAQKFDSMVTKADSTHREQLVQQINAPQPQYVAQAPVSSYWHMKTIQPPQQIQQATPQPQAPPTPQYDTSFAGRQLQYAAAEAGQGSSYNGPALSLPTIDYSAARTPGSPAGAAAQQYSQPAAQNYSAPAQTVTDITDPAILELANNNDLNVATIAREAKARMASSNDEIVVDLH